MKKIFKILGSTILIIFVADIIFLSALPKLVAYISKNMGYHLDSSNLMIKYSMGIGVRLVGLILFLYILKKTEIIKWYSCKMNINYLKLSWLFFIYICVNLEISSASNMNIMPVIFMIVESLIIGLYEETVFRGLVLPLFLRKWGINNKQIMISVILSSVIFGLFHISNLFTGASFIEVVIQVCYTTIMGIAFSALLLRTKGNLLWCGMIHGLYNMASGFGDFDPTVHVVNQSITISILPYLLNLLLFIPLLIYGLFLLRRVSEVSEDGKIVIV